MSHRSPRAQEPSPGRTGYFIASLCFLGLGAGLMFLADPVRGRDRRARLRERLVHGGRVLRDTAAATSRDVGNRTHGFVAEAKARLTRSPGSDEALQLRLRARVGHVVSHPHAVRAEVKDGHATLSGPVLAHEVEPLLASARRIPGVQGVENRLTVYREPGKVPALQGGRSRGRGHPSHAARLLMALGGTLCVVNGMRRRGVTGMSLAALGATLLARSATHGSLRALFGYGPKSRGVIVEKAIDIDASIEQVYTLWADYSKFPRFMPMVRTVRCMEGNRSHWTISGPAGMPMEWTSETTALVPNRMIAWRTLPGSAVAHRGVVRFDAGTRGTRVTIRIRYLPLAGAVGHAIAKFFGADARSELDAALLRMKTALETGRLPHDAAAGPGSAPLATFVPES